MQALNAIGHSARKRSFDPSPFRDEPHIAGAPVGTSRRRIGNVPAHMQPLESTLTFSLQRHALDLIHVSRVGAGASPLQVGSDESCEADDDQCALQALGAAAETI